MSLNGESHGQSRSQPRKAPSRAEVKRLETAQRLARVGGFALDVGCHIHICFDPGRLDHATLKNRFFTTKSAKRSEDHCGARRTLKKFEFRKFYLCELGVSAVK
jgi:hypothetical protein